MKIWVCQLCGRSMLAKKQPNYCYFDRNDSLEQISREEATKIGLFRGKTEELIDYLKDQDNVLRFIPEFQRDIRFDPFTGRDTSDSLSTLLQLKKR